MSNKSLGNPYDSNVSLIHTKGCSCSTCQAATDQKSYSQALEQNKEHTQPVAAETTDLHSVEDYMDRAVENAIVRAVFNQDDGGRRRFLQAIGGGTLAAALSSVIPLGAIKAAAKEAGGPLEKKTLKSVLYPLPAQPPSSWHTPWAFMPSMVWMWK